MSRLRSTAAFNSIVRDLREEWGHGFQRAVHALLLQGWPDLRYAADLTSRLDRAGVDLFLGESPTYDLVVQCKGYQAPLQKGHVKEIVRSVGRFQESGLRCKTYWLAVNRPVTDAEIRNSIDATLAALVRSGAAEDATWLDAPDLVENLVRRSVEELKDALPHHNRTYLTRYAAQMREGRAYMPSVPFRKWTRNVTPGLGRKDPARVTYTPSDGKNPLHDASSDLLAGYANKQAAPKPMHTRAYRIVLSEFGFGKTSLMLELATRLSASGRPAIYVPLVEIPEHAFATEHTFVAALYDLVLVGEWEADKGAAYVPLLAFRRALRTDPMFVLLLDGLDEHRLSYSADGLSRMFSCFRDLTCDVIVSARTEFWEGNRGNLDHALKGTGNDRRFQVLLEWDCNAMLGYIQEFPRTLQTEELIRVIVEDRYDEIYGDIPKRPLFLEMLVEDLAGGATQPGSLSELYRRCLERKMERDISSPFAQSAGITRPLPISDLDLGELRRRMLDFLTELAGLTLVQDPASDRPLIRETFPQSDVMTAAAKAGLGSAAAVPLLLHSILASTSRKSDSGESMMRFAHRSYQEYFLARSLTATSEAIPPGLSRLVMHFIHELRGGHNVQVSSDAAPELFLL